MGKSTIQEVSGPHRIWSTREINLLGTDYDRVIAERIDRSEKAVAQKRRQLEIEPYSGQYDWTGEEDQLLGTDSDRAIAEQLGRSVRSVRCRRQRLGLPAHG